MLLHLLLKQLEVLDTAGADQFTTLNELYIRVRPRIPRSFLLNMQPRLDGVLFWFSGHCFLCRPGRLPTVTQFDPGSKS